MNTRESQRHSPRARRTVRLAVVLALVVAGSACAALAQENDDCLMCHEDSDLTGTA